MHENKVWGKLLRLVTSTRIFKKRFKSTLDNQYFTIDLNRISSHFFPSANSWLKEKKQMAANFFFPLLFLEL